MTTESLGEKIPEIDRSRLATYKRITGKSIENTKQYLKMINLNWIKILLIPPNKYLFKFVIKG
jgi:hypothetical protein